MKTPTKYNLLKKIQCPKLFAKPAEASKLNTTHTVQSTAMIR
jgi:hypothetical protein